MLINVPPESIKYLLLALNNKILVQARFNFSFRVAFNNQVEAGSKDFTVSRVGYLGNDRVVKLFDYCVLLEPSDCGKFKSPVFPA